MDAYSSIDITNAYLNANLDTVIYMKQPTGYEIDYNKMCKLRKAIYGLHQSGHQWFLELENKLIKLKFKKLEWVNCVYMFEDNVILLFYVDDMIIFGKEMENVNFVLQLLQKNFDLKIMGKTKKLLGIEFEVLGNSLFIHQRSYIRRLCEIYEKYKYPVSSLPISKGQVLSKLDSPKTSEEILTVPYRNLIGSLSFIAICTRPDIMYAVNVLSQFQANPGIKHWNCLLRLLGYLKYTQEYKLELSKVESLKLGCYSDSDFATNRDDRVSMGGFITFIDETPISWRTFKQKSVSLLTMEADCQVIYSQFGLAIHQNDHQARRRFVEWAQNEIAVVPDFHKRILYSDEAHFWLNGYVNKQNCRIWSEANPQVYVETPLHLEKLTVWCALWAGGILLQKR
ncbi:retrovirus-related Pol polyprotein from transposon TNT 1-94 [Trichonephila clavipes]|nr:retrovirus-related Pol polyprotein from transposon TNT 1-94 [Trichonephila clavipes]